MLTNQLNEIIAIFVDNEFDFIDDFFVHYVEHKYPNDKRKQKKFCYTLMLSMLFFRSKHNFIKLYHELLSEHTEFEFYEFFNECRNMCLDTKRISYPNYANLDQSYMKEEEWILVLNKTLEYDADEINRFREKLKSKLLKVKHEKVESVSKYCRNEDYNLSFFLSEILEAFSDLYDKEKRGDNDATGDQDFNFTARFSRAARHEMNLTGFDKHEYHHNDSPILMKEVIAPNKDKQREKEKITQQIKDCVRRTNQYKISCVKLMAYLGEIDPIYTDIKALINEQRDAIVKIKRDKITGRLVDDFNNQINMSMLNFIEKGSALNDGSSKQLLKILLSTDARYFKMLTDRKSEYVPHVKRLVKSLKEKIFDEKFSILKGNDSRGINNLKDELQKIFKKYQNLENSDYFLLSTCFKNAEINADNELTIDNVLDRVSNKIVGMVNKVLLEDSDFDEDEEINQEILAKNYETGQKKYRKMTEQGEVANDGSVEMNHQLLDEMVKEQNYNFKKHPENRILGKNDKIESKNDTYARDKARDSRKNESSKNNSLAQSDSCRQQNQTKSRNETQLYIEEGDAGRKSREKNVFDSDLNSVEAEKKSNYFMNAGSKVEYGNNELGKDFNSFNPTIGIKKSESITQKGAQFESFIVKEDKSSLKQNKDPSKNYTNNKGEKPVDRPIRNSKQSDSSKLSKISERSDLIGHQKDSNQKDDDSKNSILNQNIERDAGLEHKIPGKFNNDIRTNTKSRGEKPSSNSRDKQQTLPSMRSNSRESNSLNRTNSHLSRSGSAKDRRSNSRQPSTYADIYKKKESMKELAERNERWSNKSLEKRSPSMKTKSEKRENSPSPLQLLPEHKPIRKTEMEEFMVSEVIQQKKNSNINRFERMEDDSSRSDSNLVGNVGKIEERSPQNSQGKRGIGNSMKRNDEAGKPSIQSTKNNNETDKKNLVSKNKFVDSIDDSYDDEMRLDRLISVDNTRKTSHLKNYEGADENANSKNRTFSEPSEPQRPENDIRRSESNSLDNKHTNQACFTNADRIPDRNDEIIAEEDYDNPEDLMDSNSFSKIHHHTVKRPSKEKIKSDLSNLPRRSSANLNKSKNILEPFSENVEHEATRLPIDSINLLRSEARNTVPGISLSDTLDEDIKINKETSSRNSQLKHLDHSAEDEEFKNNQKNKQSNRNNRNEFDPQTTLGDKKNSEILNSLNREGTIVTFKLSGTKEDDLRNNSRTREIQSKTRNSNKDSKMQNSNQLGDEIQSKYDVNLSQKDSEVITESKDTLEARKSTLKESYDVNKSGIKESIKKAALTYNDSIQGESVMREFGNRESFMNSIGDDNLANRRDNKKSTKEDSVPQNNSNSVSDNMVIPKNNNIKLSDGSAIMETKSKKLLRNIESGVEKNSDLSVLNNTIINSLVDNTANNFKPSSLSKMDSKTIQIENKPKETQFNKRDNFETAFGQNPNNQLTNPKPDARNATNQQGNRDTLRNDEKSMNMNSAYRDDSRMPDDSRTDFSGISRPTQSNKSNLKNPGYSQLDVSKIDKLRSIKHKKGQVISQSIGVSDNGKKNVETFFKNFWGDKDLNKK